MSGGSNNGKLSEGAVKLLFTAAFIIFAVVLFLSSESGKRLLAGESALIEPESAEEPEAAAFGVTQAEFRKALDALDANIEIIEEDAKKAVYSIIGSERSSELTLSLNRGRAQAFSIVWQLAPAPEELEEDASIIERDLYDMAVDEYLESLRWIESLFLLCSEKLDADGDLGATTLQRLSSLIAKYAADEKNYSDNVGEFVFDLYPIASGETGSFAVSLSRKE